MVRLPNWMMAECRLQSHLWGPQETWGPPWPSSMYPPQHRITVHIGRVWSACRPTPVHDGPPIDPAQAVAHQIIAATGALRGPLLHQVSRPTWVKPSRRPKNPPQSSESPLTWLLSTKMYRCSHPASSEEETSGLSYRCAHTLPTQPQRSPRPPPPTMLHRRPLKPAK